MQNTNWLLICVDTAYVDFDMDDLQIEWVERIIAGAGVRKILLFSHHQPYSLFNDNALNLRRKLSHILDSGRIYAWFFGHEHYLILYDAHTKWGLSARCVGHGGFPEFRPTLPGCGGANVQFVRMAATGEAPKSDLLDGPNSFIKDDPSDPDKYSPHGYLTLTFDGPTVDETYFDPNGDIRRGPAKL